MARRVVHSERCKDQGKTLARRRDIDPLRGTLVEKTNRLIRERGALLGVEDLKHRGDLVGHRRENGRSEFAWADRRLGVEQIGHQRLLEQTKVDLAGLFLLGKLLFGERVDTRRALDGLHDEGDELTDRRAFLRMGLRQAEGLLVVPLQGLLEAQDNLATRVRRQLDGLLDERAEVRAKGFHLLVIRLLGRQQILGRDLLRWPGEERVFVSTSQMTLASTGFVCEGELHGVLTPCKVMVCGREDRDPRVERSMPRGPVMQTVRGTADRRRCCAFYRQRNRQVSVLSEIGFAQPAIRHSVARRVAAGLMSVLILRALCSEGSYASAVGHPFAGADTLTTS